MITLAAKDVLQEDGVEENTNSPRTIAIYL